MGMGIPVLANNGRDVLGRATTKAGAARLLRKTLTIHPRMTLEVWRRCPVAREINGGPDGWMYGICYKY